MYHYRIRFGWYSGRTLACQAGGLTSKPGWTKKCFLLPYSISNYDVVWSPCLHGHHICYLLSAGAGWGCAAPFLRVNEPTKMGAAWAKRGQYQLVLFT
jgi:hypothetical protein